ncbi:plastidal glycolate/glycerate translocator 1, chloroplastic [Arachis stenosperma]|uniref:plastidal glycolate/glycerate translocator 1, chloroplastic n=1 Tax=Arachis stenosperma TaxID=217475 RepID=UPI0025AD540D|nr:plastidal glycolate/glycerate translocator 1, chloroplastic [Arachis stenosperma]
MSTPENTQRQQLLPKQAEPSTGSSTSSPLIRTLGLHVLRLLNWVVPLALFLGVDLCFKKVFQAASFEFPSALFVMFCIFTVLMVLDYVNPFAALAFLNFFDPGVMFINRWLPLFYVPYLVVLPISVREIPASSAIKICCIIVGGWLATLSVSGFTAIAVRKAVKTEMIDPEPMEKPPPFSSIELWSWIAVFLISFIMALLFPTALGTAARTCFLFYLASTVVGYIVGSGLPSKVKMIFHPVIFSLIFPNLVACAFGLLSKQGYDAALGFYLTESSSDPGAGDILLEFLGPVILSFAFSMFKQRTLMKRHAAEIFTSVIVSTLFSLYSTAIVGRLVALDPSLTVSILPRCITVALALNIVSLFEGANLALTAAVVVATGLIGANFVQSALNILRLHDPIARGIAAASSSHGLATAALSAEEPEALPFSAIAYALTGIFGSLFCTIPAARQSLLAIAGSGWNS